MLGGRFQLLRRLGAGAFGTVYEAEDTDHKQRIAVKQLHVLDGDALYRFKQEFRSAQDIVHPNIVALKELFSADGHWYMTMDFIDGVDFHAWLRSEAGVLPEVPDDREATKRWKADHPPDVITKSYTAAYDESRLRIALVQLIEAVHALHRHNVLHRDLKPSNVMVGADARLRVLDYGLAAPMGREGLHTSTDELVVGTPGYMSPEQAEGAAISTPSDWYSVGAMVFEVLTGKLPFEGSARDVLWRKVHEDGPDPRVHDREVPEDLADLCRRLLVRDPAARPAYEELVTIVGRSATRDEVPVFAGDTVFVGRATELATLKQAAARAIERSVVVHVQGPSGVGKSALVRRFVEDVDAVVLAGRCFERESVPFKALDSLVDALTQHLRGLTRSEVESVVPQHAAALARVFPVLSRLDAFAGARIVDRVTDPNEIRRRAATALRELLGRLGKLRPIVLWIDDLQWGDADSAVLFRELVAPPDPPPMLLVLGYRIEDAAADMVAAVRGRRSIDHWIELALEPLGSAEAEQLAETLLGVRSSQARRVANESGGVPFYVHELARNVTSGTAFDHLTLVEVLAQRIAALPPSARRLLDVVAAAGGPISQRVARGAAGSGLDEVILLRAARFLRSRGNNDRDLVECFHDRVRETALEQLADPIGIHRAIAQAYEREPVPDPEAIVAQYRAAGDDEQTLIYAERAAALAEHKLAFDRAVDLYALAKSLAPADRRQHFAVRYADALANAGRGAAAATAFRIAADGASTDVESVRLRTRAAEQFLRSGLVDEGIEQLQPALQYLDLRMPGSPRSALVTLLARRVRLKFRGLRFSERDPAAIANLPAADLNRIDLCWSVGNGLGGVDMVRAATFQAQHLLLALDAGEPYRVSRALAWESIVRSMEGGAKGRRRAGELGASAKAIADRIQHPHARAWAVATEAIAAECEGRWQDAQSHSFVTIALFREAQTDVAWEVGSMYAWWLLPALYMAGDLAELAYRAPSAVGDADAVGDLYTSTSLRTYLMPLVHLVAGHPGRADDERADAIGGWSRAGWHLQHWCDVKARAEIALYRGEGAAAVAAWDAERGQLSASLLMRMYMVGIQTRYSLGRALVLAAETDRSPVLLRRAAKCAAQLAAHDTGWAKQFGQTIAAGVAMRRGDHDRGLALLAAAAAGYRAIDMVLHAHACELVRGRVIGGESGRQLVTSAETWMASQDVADPLTLARSLAPGFAS